MGCSEEARSWIEIFSAAGESSAFWSGVAGRLGAARLSGMLSTERGREELRWLTGRNAGPPDDRRLARTLDFLEGERNGVICRSDPGYPRLLLEIEGNPPLIFFSGDPEVASRPSIGIVGSRKASRRGLAVSCALARELSRRGLLVVSGLALGIDSAAHTGALQGPGGTCAVLGCGIDVPYPRDNAGLSVDIAAAGCVFSEFLPGAPPRKHHFPRRNRILSGLSLGIVVVEAGRKSGAMSTARWAADQGREVFAVPGPVEHEGSRGPHLLIREGAVLVESAEDVIRELPPRASVPEPFDVTEKRAGLPGISPRLLSRLSADERRIVEALDLAPKHIDELSRICHISATGLLTLLLGLEMRGIISSCGGGTYALPAGPLRI